MENLRIQEEMKLEEMKYLALKEKEYKLKEDEMESRYGHKLDTIKEELLQQQKQFEQKIIEQKKKNQEIEEKYKEVAKHSESIKIELEEKQIKEQLFA